MGALRMQTREFAKIYRRVADAPTAERDSVLARECRGNEEIRREVERLLREEKLPSSAEILRRDRSIDSIGPHRVIRRIASGGMGDVFEAQQNEPKRRVAIKVLRHAALNERALARFHREAEILARLKHPGIAQIHAFGTTGDDRPYIVMELVEGPKITRGSADLDLDERIERMAAVCDAVDHAHRNGVIHRDLKPANVLVTPEGEPKVVDFGVARSVDADITQTIDGTVIGTLAYMSPEQARGANVDTRSDIYALGVLAHVLVTGEHPMEGGGAAVTLHALVTNQPMRCTVSGDLGLVIAKAMSPEADLRYASAAEMAEDLRRAARGEPVLASNPHPYRMLRRFLKRHWLPVMLGLGCMATLLVGYIVALRGEERALSLAARAEVRVAEAALHDDNPMLALDHLKRVPARLRFWEWRYVNAAADRTAQRVPRSSKYFVAGLDGRLQPGRIEVREGPRSVAAITEDFDIKGRAGSSAQWDGQDRMVRPQPITLVDEATGRLLADIQPVQYQRHALNRVVWSDPDTLYHVDNSRLSVRDAATGKTRFVADHSNLIYAVALDAGRTVVATGSHDSLVRVWSLEDGRMLHEFSEHRSSVRALGFDEDGARLASASTDGTVCVFDLATGKRTHRFVSPRGPTGVAFRPCASQLYCIGVHELATFDLSEPERRVLRPHASRDEGNEYPYIYATDVSDNGKLVLSGSWEGAIARRCLRRAPTRRRSRSGRAAPPLARRGRRRRRTARPEPTGGERAGAA